MTKTIDTSVPKVARFLDVFDDRMLAGDLGPRLNCGEVEALAGMLRAVGSDPRARPLLGSRGTPGETTISTSSTAARKS